jgi:hypothetical protein
MRLDDDDRFWFLKFGLAALVLNVLGWAAIAAIVLIALNIAGVI